MMNRTETWLILLAALALVPVFYGLIKRSKPIFFMGAAFLLLAGLLWVVLLTGGLLPAAAGALSI